MLKFYRQGFRAGAILVKEPEGEGEKVYKFTVKDQNKEFEFLDEAYVLGKYPVLFTAVQGE